TFTCGSLNTAVATVTTSGSDCVASATGTGQVIVAAEAERVSGHAVLNVAYPSGTTPVSSWGAMASGFGTANIRGVWGTSPSNVYVVGEQGAIRRYDGSSWSTITSGATITLLGLWGSSANDIYAYGGGAALPHYDGSSWTVLSNLPGSHITAMWGDAPYHIHAAVDGNRMFTFDGSTWTERATLGQQVNAIWGSASNHVIAVGNAGSLHLFDGNSWSPMASSGSWPDLNAVWGTAFNDVYAVGAGGTIIRYAGATWSRMVSNTTERLNAIYGSGTPDIYAVGNEGTILRYDGASWLPMPSGTNQALHGVFGNSTSGMITAGSNSALRVGARAVVSAPAAPSNLAANAASSSEIDLTWTNNAADAHGFRIERCTGNNCTTGFAEIAAVPVTIFSYRDGTLPQPDYYTYRIRAYNSGGNSGYSASAVGTALDFSGSWAGTTSQNDSIITFQVLDNALTTVTFGWQVPACGVSGKTTTNFGTPIDVSSGNFSRTGILAGSLTYGISGSFSSQTAATGSLSLSWNDGVCSSSASATWAVALVPPPPTAPSGLTATVIPATRIDLTWTDNSSNEDGFAVERCAGVGCSTFAEIATVGANATSYENTGLSASTSYTYQVRAYNSGGNSAYSNTVTASTPAGPAWSQLSPTGGPPDATGGGGAIAALDAVNNTLILFGGITPASAHTNGVWILTTADGAGGTPNWTNPIPNGTAGSPAARHAHRVAYDLQNNRLIVFGGCAGGCLPTLNDVWVLTNANGVGGTPAWTQLAPTGGPPAGRAHPAMVYDPVGNRLIVFGGQDGGGSGGSTYAEVWVLSNANGLGGDPVWSQLTTSGTFPAGQYGPSAVYDATNNRMTVFGGGAQGTGVSTNAVAVLSNANGTGGTPTWTTLVSEGAVGSPAPRSFHSAGYDGAANRMIIFGAGTADGLNPWVLTHANGLGGTATWAQLNPTGGPPTATGTAVFRRSSNRLTVLGDQSSPGALWVLTGANGQ
ncbi:MAG: fibronectin type III domain-containing protein, partial [Gemmatimonadetes bacterium]|nr:fibronectin type III domain-containing protein [Gemmatimonadota bacterium]